VTVRPTRLPLVHLCLVTALSAGLLAGCAAGQEEDTAAPDAGAAPAPAASDTSGTASPTSASPTSSPTASVSVAPSPSVRTVEAAYTGGEVTGTSGREEVPLGERVVLRITSDVAEEVHVHGYDLEQAVPAGGTVDIPVDATIPGVFEVELHDAGRLLFQLRVA
jgi:hypothetical protein